MSKEDVNVNINLEPINNDDFAVVIGGKTIGEVLSKGDVFDAQMNKQSIGTVKTEGEAIELILSKHNLGN